jgi:hypothetical protein
VKEALGALALFTAHATLKIIDRPDFLNFAKTRLIGLGSGLWGWQEQERRADTADHATHDLAFAAGEIDIHKDEVVGLQHREDQALNLSPASRRSEPTPCLCVLIIGVRKTRGAFDMDDVNERRGSSDWLRSAFRLSGVKGWSLCFQAISGDVP